MAKIIQLPKNLYLPLDQDSTPGIFNYANTHAQAGDTVIFPPGPFAAQTRLIVQGRKFSSVNPLNPDPASRPHVIRSKYTKGEDVVELRAEHETTDTTKWHGGEIIGFDIEGSNQNWNNTTWVQADYQEMGVYVDDKRSHQNLNAATFCDIHHTAGDPYYGGGTALACRLRSAGRHGRTMMAHGAKMVACLVNLVHGRNYAVETAHPVFGIEITDTIFGGPNAGYMTATVEPGTDPVTGVTYDFGAKFQRNHSSLADLSGVDTLVDWAWGGFWNCVNGPDLPRSKEVWITDNKFVGLELDDRIDVLNWLDPHYAQSKKYPSLQVPGMSVHYCDGIHVLRNEHLCKGPFAEFKNCTNASSDGNVGGPMMTAQM